jgi:cob(I)alamin adenosyltransferase
MTELDPPISAITGSRIDPAQRSRATKKHRRIRTWAIYMKVSTKKGDTGYTGILGGQRVPKDHIVIEVEGALDEASSHIGLARASSRVNRSKRVLLLVQKHFFVMGAGLSALKESDRTSRKGLTESHMNWLDRLVEEYEEALNLPPGFVAFGQEESSSQFDVARTSVRKVERGVVRMKNEGMPVNAITLKYLNRLSDLLFLLACLEEKDQKERQKISRAFAFQALTRPGFRKWIMFMAAIVLTLVTVIVLLLLFHGKGNGPAPGDMLEQMERMHQTQQP